MLKLLVYLYACVCVCVYVNMGMCGCVCAHVPVYVSTDLRVEVRSQHLVFFFSSLDFETQSLIECEAH